MTRALLAGERFVFIHMQIWSGPTAVHLRSWLRRKPPEARPSGSFEVIGKKNFRSSIISAQRLVYMVFPMCSMNMAELVFAYWVCCLRCVNGLRLMPIWYLLSSAAGLRFPSHNAAAAK